MNHGLADGSSQSTPPSLPVELGFLLGRGFTFEELRQFGIGAKRAGVSADRYILAANLVDETAYYRALALELTLPFTSGGRVSRRARFPESIHAGLAPLEAPAGAFLIAPRGAGLVRLLHLRRFEGHRLVVTTPSALLRAVLHAKAGAVSHQASNALPEWRADLSFRAGWLWSQIVALCVLLFMLALSMSFGPHAPVVGLSLGATPLFLGMVVTRLAACLLSGPVASATPLRRAPDVELPSYTVIAALYREAAVVRKFITALYRIDYPREKLDIKIVIEADDRETMAALAAIRLPAHMAIIIAPPGFPRTKPRALNVALPLARGDLTVVYDAEDEPDPDQLRLAAGTFADAPADVGCLQARLTIDNTRDTWLTRLFTIEYAALFDVLNPGLASIGSPILLGGTSNHFRTATLQAMCGWDAWNVTEDADLGIRLARLGHSVADLPSSTIEEAPSTLAAWMRQRTRWMKGYIQTCIAHSRHPMRTARQLGTWRAYGAMIVTLGTVLSALGYPLFSAFVAFSWWEQSDTTWNALLRAFSTALFTAGIVAIYVPAMVGLSRRRLWELLPWTLLLPGYYLLVSIAAWCALWELIWTPFQWNKTAHGLARTTRQKVPQKHHARAASTMSSNTAAP